MTTPDERKARKVREATEWAAHRTPIACPKCGRANLAPHLVTWFAHSLDDCDLHNTAELAEHQCHDCGTSFWM